MGNTLKKNEKKNKKKEKDKEKPKNKNKNIKTTEELIKNNPDALVIDDYISLDNIDLELLKKQNHSIEKDPIEEIIIHPKFENSIIIGSRSGKIKLYKNINERSISNEIILYNVNEKIFSMIVLKKNNNNIAIGLLNKILILIFNSKNLLEKELELIGFQSQLKEVNLLELSNSNIISAGDPFIYWEQNNNKYKQSGNIIQNDKKCRFINMVEFEEYNTILATQEKTHEIYLIKYDKEKIELIKKIEKCSSISYKGSAQKLSDNFMLLVGKFDLNVLDASNGEVTNRYIGIDKGSLLNLTENNNEDDIWIVSDFYGKFFEFYNQEGNDLIFLDKIELDEENEIKWNNRLVRINNQCFVVVNYLGEIFVFNVKLKNI